MEPMALECGGTKTSDHRVISTKAMTQRTRRHGRQGQERCVAGEK